MGYMPEKDLDGNRWICTGYCNNPTLKKESKK